MKVIFRVDASSKLGVGHVIRCLSLARLLISKGASVRFISFPLPGALRGDILEAGCELKEIEDCYFNQVEAIEGQQPDEMYLWPSRRQLHDASCTLRLIADRSWDWMVVDHYSISSVWESLIKEKVKNLFAIDDLANRNHNCDALLDQTLGRAKVDYEPYVPKVAKLLVGARFAMLRPEFSELRDYSLSRRNKPNSKKLLISLGGGDFDNATAKILDVLSSISFIKSWKITVVLGAVSPWAQEIKKLIQLSTLEIKLIVNCSSMAKVMCDSDLAIGAAGSSSWERCCLGLPTIMIKTAPNQSKVANELEKVGAAISIQSIEKISSELPRIMLSLNSNVIDIPAMSISASRITSGSGCDDVVEMMERLN